MTKRTKNRSISARAEEPWHARRVLWRFWVDLRACGGTLARAPRLVAVLGRSPRVRRNPLRGDLERAGRGSISARAEEPALPVPSVSFKAVDLRACGGT